MSTAIHNLYSTLPSGVRERLPNAAIAARTAGFALLWIFVFLIPADEQLDPLPYWIGILSGAVGFGAVLLSGTFRRPSPAHYPLLILLLWVALSYGWSSSPDATLARLQTYAQLLILIWLMWEFAPGRQHQRGLMQAYVLGSLIPAIATLVNFFQGNQARTETLGMSDVVRYTAGSYNENDLGLVLALSLPFACYLTVSTKNRWLRILFCLQMCASVAAIVLTASRMAFAVAMLALIAAPLLLPNISAGWRVSVLVGLMVLAGFAALLVPADTWQRLSTTVDEATSGTLDGRVEIWTNALEAYKGHPFLGVGSAALSDVIGRMTGKPYVAHNTYLSILVELGCIGASLAFILGIAAFQCIRILPVLEKRCWFSVAMVWAIGVATLSWEHRKPTWFLLGLLLTQAGAVHSAIRSAPNKLWSLARA